MYLENISEYVEDLNNIVSCYCCIASCLYKKSPALVTQQVGWLYTETGRKAVL